MVILIVVVVLCTATRIPSTSRFGVKCSLITCVSASSCVLSVGNQPSNEGLRFGLSGGVGAGCENSRNNWDVVGTQREVMRGYDGACGGLPFERCECVVNLFVCYFVAPGLERCVRRECLRCFEVLCGRESLGQFSCSWALCL